MIFLLISIVCNTLLFIILKYFERVKIDTLQGIVANYFTAAALGFAFNRSGTGIQDAAGSDWLHIALILGFLFIGIFMLLAHTAQTAGISVASVANKMSVVIPVICAFLFFHDSVTWIKIAGIVLALAAVYLTSGKSGAADSRAFLLPFVVFLGSGAIDALVNFSQQKYLSEAEGPLFVAVCFSIAGLIGTMIILLRWRAVRLRNILGGIVLGIPNYFSIYTIIRALDSGVFESSVIYPLVNVGVVLLSALSGLLLFGEKFTLMNKLGILIAVMAIALIASAG
ncbi:MAG: EamA family transporter [Bacteroidota bacterium]